ncbi:MAG: DUF2288 family protein [Hormoscilla sp. GM7CHS1pb]|nr:DUF2288 family protein [Hormoscilla sp. GM7CHS1pb]
MAQRGAAINLDEAEWEWLKPHLARDVVVVVVPPLDLLEVGEAIAGDRVSSVSHWISEQLLAKPTAAQIANWSGLKRFRALIVEPYVLVQELSS